MIINSKILTDELVPEQTYWDGCLFWDWQYIWAVSLGLVIYNLACINFYLIVYHHDHALEICLVISIRSTNTNDFHERTHFYLINKNVRLWLLYSACWHLRSDNFPAGDHTFFRGAVQTKLFSANPCYCQNPFCLQIFATFCSRKD